MGMQAAWTKAGLQVAYTRAGTPPQRFGALESEALRTDILKTGNQKVGPLETRALMATVLET